MSWGVPFLYEICTGCTVSIDPILCVCILGVLPQDMETVEFLGSDLKCSYLTVEINTYERRNQMFAQFTTFDLESCDLDLDSRIFIIQSDHNKLCMGFNLVPVLCFYLKN